MEVSITNQLIIKEATARGIEHEVLSGEYNIVLLKHQGTEKMIRWSCSANTSAVFSCIADNKDITYTLAEKFGIPHPQSVICKSEADFKQALQVLSYPLVIKPSAGAHGKGVYVNLQNESECYDAYKKVVALNQGDTIVQQYFEGHDYRIMVVNHKMIAVTKRVPAHVYGDGISTLKELIAAENTNPLRGHDHDHPLTTIDIDDNLLKFIAESGKTIDFVPTKDECVYLRAVGNLSQGGEAEDITDDVPEENVKLFEDIAKQFQAETIGIDILAKDPTKVFTDKDYTLIEMNAFPGIRMHHFPSKGKPRDVAGAILDMMFPESK